MFRTKNSVKKRQSGLQQTTHFKTSSDRQAFELSSLSSTEPAFTVNAPIATKFVCFSRLLKCLRSFYGKRCGPKSGYIGAVCSGSTLFASILNSSVMLGNYLQQTTSADDIFRYIFSWRFKYPNHGFYT